MCSHLDKCEECNFMLFVYNKLVEKYNLDENELRKEYCTQITQYYLQSNVYIKKKNKTLT